MPSAATEEAFAVRAMLERIGLATGDQRVRLAALTGGYRNRVYRLQREGECDAVVKIFTDAPENPMFPTLPDHEAAALALLSGRSIAPEPITATVDPALGHVLIYTMVAGDPWSAGATAVGRLLRRVHDVDVTGGGFSFRRLLVAPDDIAAHANAMLADVDERTAARITKLVKAAQRLVRSGPQESCLVHTDPGPGNVIVGADDIRLIDWQCPGLGDPVEDLAAFVSPAIQFLYEHQPLRQDEVADMLHGYTSEPERAVAMDRAVERFLTKGVLFRARTAAYCASRAVSLAAVDPPVADRYRRALGAELDALEEVT
jgi:Ser/Thr protein kinase RdoA (MazF antagonist)